MVVSAPPGNVIGSVQRLCSLGTKFSIKDESGETVLTIKGDVCLLALGRDINFNVIILIFPSLLLKKYMLFDL